MSTPTPRFITEGKRDSPVCPKNYIHKKVEHDSTCIYDHNHILLDGFCYSPYPILCEPGIYKDENGQCYTRRSLADLEKEYVPRFQNYTKTRRESFKSSDMYGPYSFESRDQLLKDEEQMPYIQFYSDMDDEEKKMQDQYDECVSRMCPTGTDDCKKACRQYVPQMDCEEQFDEYQNAPEVQPNKKEIRSRAMQCKHIGMANCVHENLFIPYYGPDMIDIPTRMKSIYKSRFGEEFPANMCEAEVTAYKDAYPLGNLKQFLQKNPKTKKNTVYEYERYLGRNYMNAVYNEGADRVNLQEPYTKEQLSQYNSRDIAIVNKTQDLANEKLTACMRGVYETREAKDTMVTADKRPDALRRAVCRRSTYKTLQK